MQKHIHIQDWGCNLLCLKLDKVSHDNVERNNNALLPIIYSPALSDFLIIPKQETVRIRVIKVKQGYKRYS